LGTVPDSVQANRPRTRLGTVPDSVQKGTTKDGKWTEFGTVPDSVQPAWVSGVAPATSLLRRAWLREGAPGVPRCLR